MTEWVEEQETVSERLVPVDNSIYDFILVQSDTESRFAEKLKKRSDVRLFVKLPSWFRVATPVGYYNPDWGLVMEEVDAFGEPGPALYLVRETKSTTVADALRGTENQKIHCGERHFVGALGSTCTQKGRSARHTWTEWRVWLTRRRSDHFKSAPDSLTLRANESSLRTVSPSR
jgi:hypothetical protein